MKLPAVAGALALLLAPQQAASRKLPLRSFAGPCLAWIIDREDPSWDPGRWNASGSGAFGLPQALPYSKMPKPAWPRYIGKRYVGGREDGYAQIRWMRGYARGRYGSECGAVAFWRSHGWY